MICNTGPWITGPLALGHSWEVLVGAIADRFKLNSHGDELWVSKKMGGVPVGWTGTWFTNVYWAEHHCIWVVNLLSTPHLGTDTSLHVERAKYLHLDQPYTEFHRSSFKFVGAKLFNILPENIRSVSNPDKFVLTSVCFCVLVYILIMQILLFLLYCYVELTRISIHLCIYSSDVYPLTIMFILMYT